MYILLITWAHPMGPAFTAGLGPSPDPLGPTITAAPLSICLRRAVFLRLLLGDVLREGLSGPKRKTT